MAISRRDALKSLGAVPFLQWESRPPVETLTLIAEVVLPSEADRGAAVAAFVRWIDGYKEGADTDHGYGNTRLRKTAASPARNYPAQLAALEAMARAAGLRTFAAGTIGQRRAILEAAIADAKVDRLPARPTGAHIATDLMGHYFNSSAANDLCYRASIGRDACRGLAGSDKAPAALLTRRPGAPRASHPAPRASRPAPRASHPAPRASGPAPRTSHSAPRASHPAPRASRPAPRASRLAPRK